MPGVIRQQACRLLKLEVDNFKSYKGKQDIGPFHSFTAVIGPNGSGKSNLMDAISFVLGVKGMQLRGSLKELICSHSNEGEDERATSAFVRLILEMEDGRVTTFKRSITQASGKANYTSTYHIDESPVTWAAYEDRLKGFGILIKARNFLVFQGDIEAVAGKQALELTKLFETISGSDAYKADFDELEVKRKEAQDKLAFVQSKKKNTAAEKRQKREQKTEAEKHIKMQQELEQLKSTFFLWQLFKLDHDKKEAEGELEQHTEKLRDIAKTLKAIEKQVKEAKEKEAGLNKKRLLIQNNIKQSRKKGTNENDQLSKAETEVKGLRAKVKAEEKTLQKLESEAAVNIEKLQTCQRDLEALQAEAPVDEDQEMSQRLDDSIRAELPKVEVEAKARNSKNTQDLLLLRNSKESAEADLQSKQKDIETINARIEYLRNKQEDRSSTSGDNALQALLKDQAAKRKELADHLRDATGFRVRRESAMERLNRALEHLQANRSRHREDERAQKTLAVLSDLKRLFKGVHGRMSELGRIPHDAYKVALAVTMAQDMDSVVVDNEQTAKECVKYLKQHRVQPMTFLPLQTIKVKPANPRLRNLGGTTKMAIDLVEYKPEFERAFMSACGNTLVCDGIDEARYLAYGNERHKVVTKDGLLIGKSGAMTGGGTYDLANKAERFNEAENKRYQDDYDRAEAMLRELPGEEDCRRKQIELESKLAGLESQIRKIQSNLTVTSKQVEDLDAEIKNLEQESTKKEGEIEDLAESIEQASAKMVTLEERISATTDKIYADLSKKAGVNIREYLDKNKDHDEMLNKQKTDYRIQESKLQQTIKFLSRSNAALPVTQKKLEASRLKLAEKEEILEGLQEAAREAVESANAQTRELTEIEDSIKEANAKRKELEKAETEQTRIGTKARNVSLAMKGEIEGITSQQEDLLKTAALEQVKLPKLQEEDEGMDADESEVDKEVRQLDFSTLNRQHKAAVSKDAASKLEEDFQKDIEARREVLARVAPNLKALEQYEEAKTKDDKERAELETARQANSEAQNAFHAKRQQRSDKFMAAFDHIKDAIDPIYKDLTKSKLHPMGGTAYLSLVSTDVDPFLSGLSFTAMPPSKRWRQMEALSGGEKTIAALALLFAIHSYNPAPFFILDEVDAALDAVNVAKVANYIRERTRSDDQMPDFQAIVISLKDYFFSKADALVGVTKTPSTGCSTTFTLDLSQYPETVH